MKGNDRWAQPAEHPLGHCGHALAYRELVSVDVRETEVDKAVDTALRDGALHAHRERELAKIKAHRPIARSKNRPIQAPIDRGGARTKHPSVDDFDVTAVTREATCGGIAQRPIETHHLDGATMRMNFSHLPPPFRRDPPAFGRERPTGPLRVKGRKRRKRRPVPEPSGGGEPAGTVPASRSDP